MDVIGLSKNGIENSVANLGTALTSKQIQILNQFYNHIIICFDGDQSGLNASYRAAERVLKILKPGKDIYFTKIPNSQDPDDFINQFGYKGFISLIAKSFTVSYRALCSSLNFIYNPFYSKMVFFFQRRMRTPHVLLHVQCIQQIILQHV